MAAPRWSTYNLLFESPRFGWLLYNSLSNAFAQLPPEAAAWVGALREQPERAAEQPELALQLQAMKALVEPNEEKELLDVLRLKRARANFHAHHLTLTVAVTQACNFDCVYCYEEHRPSIALDEATEAKLVEFVKAHEPLRLLHVIWYGGEPLLAWGRVQSTTARLQGLGIPYHAGLITNGWLLTREVAGQLDALGITRVQVTLDGPAEVHDQRRRLVDGRGTFGRILENVEGLLETWGGQVAIRVNVDGANGEHYSALQALLRERFGRSAERLEIYPGIVDSVRALPRDLSCPGDHHAEARFYLEQHARGGGEGLKFYPTSMASRVGYGECCARTMNEYLVGPRGDLYKCWRHLGQPALKVGSVHAPSETNLRLIAQFMFGTDPFEDPECRACFCLPICGGGCPEKRRRRTEAGAAASDSCTRYKDDLPRFLEVHLEKKLGRQG